MIKTATILMETPISLLDQSHIRGLFNTMHSSGVIGTMEINGDTIILSGLFMRGVNQAVLSIGSYLKHNIGLYFIVEYSESW